VRLRPERDTARAMSDEKQLLTEAFAALSRRDVDSWLAATTPDAELHDFPARPGVFQGHDELRAWAEEALEVSSSWDVRPVEFVEGSEGRLLVRVHVTGRSAIADVPVDQNIYAVFTFKDSKVASVRNFFQEDEALEAAWLPE
jgi:ketosteroid isomerase-like protein